MAKEKCARCGATMGGLFGSSIKYTFSDGQSICRDCYWYASGAYSTRKATYAEYDQHLKELGNSSRIFHALIEPLDTSPIKKFGITMRPAPNLGLFADYSVRIGSIPKAGGSKDRYIVYRYADILEYHHEKAFDADSNPMDLLVLSFKNEDHRYTVPFREAPMSEKNITQLIAHFDEYLSGNRAELAQKADNAIKSLLG